MKSRVELVATVVLVAGWIAPTAHAGTATSNVGVSATVASVCSITAGSLGFGTYDTLSGGNVDGTATVSLACTKGATATVTLGQGQNSGTGSTDAAPVRRLASGANVLSYALYSDATRLVPWGNTSATGQPYVSTSSASSTLTVYGRIAANQDVPAGAFSDVIVATISF